MPIRGGVYTFADRPCPKVDTHMESATAIFREAAREQPRQIEWPTVFFQCVGLTQERRNN
jgi:hypothetical protein